jgi:phosphatidylethanolamine-binding protein (PEBP) family uncharacterized protein
MSGAYEADWMRRGNDALSGVVSTSVCSLVGDVRVENEAMFSLASAAFENGEQMPQKYGKKLQNLSPPVA